MNSGWMTGACGLMLGACLGYVAGNIAASAVEPFSQPVTAPAAAAAMEEFEPSGTADSGDLTAEWQNESVDGAVFFPEGSMADFPESSTDTVHASGEIESTPGDDPSRSPTEPGELPESSDAAPLADSWDDLTLRRIIDQELADVPEADREIWVEALRGLPREDVVGILRLWRKFGGTPSSILPGAPGIAAGPMNDLPGNHFDLGALGDDDIPSPLVPEPPPAEFDATVAALLTARRIIINNLLNAETIGFRRREVLYSEAGPGVDGVSVTGTRIDQTQGKFIDTGSLLDVGIEGPGFFVVSDGEQQYFTRCGRFSRNDEGRLVLSTGRGNLVVQPEIVIPGDMISPLVTLTAEAIAEFTQEQPGAVLPSIQIALFADPGRLEPVGDGLFVATPASGPPQAGVNVSGLSQLHVMRLEQSNVDVEVERRLLKQIDEWLDLSGSLPPN